MSRVFLRVTGPHTGLRWKADEPASAGASTRVFAESPIPW